MLRNDTFKTAIPYASALAAQGIGLNVIPGTILGELVRFSAPAWEWDGPNGQTTETTRANPAGYPLETPEDIEVWAAYMTTAANGTSDNPSQHTVQMEQLTKQLAGVITTHISYAKNVVKPEVLELADAIQSYMDNNKPISATDKFNIKAQFIPAVLKDDSFLDTLSDYKNRPALEPEGRFSFAAKTSEELTQLAMTGNARTDKLITEWLLTKEENFLKAVWEEYFTSVEGSRVIYDTLKNSIDPFERCDVALAYYLLSRKLIDDVQESSLSLSDYKNKASQYRDYSGSILVTCLSKIATMLKNNVLVCQIRSYDKTLCVNGELYGNWLAEGGSVEVLLGLLISGESVTMRTLIDQKAEEYKRRWSQFESLHRLSEQNNSVNYYRHFVLNKFTDLYKEMDPVETEFVQKNSAYVDGVFKNVKEYLDGLTAKDFANINHHELALLLIAKYRFAFTSAYQLLSDINRAGQINPNADVREAALLATINYVTDYLFDQMSIVR